jgi:AbrB family looped-hinge helix DNA binding protein
METVISSKGQVVLPVAFRERDRIAPGQKFDIERLDAGQYLLKRRSIPDNDGLVEWLLACPEKDWFVSVDSESTGAL